MRTIPKERILRVNCPGFGTEAHWNLGRAKSLNNYSAIVVNPVSIAHLFDKDPELVRKVEQCLQEGLTSLSIDDDLLLRNLAAEIDSRVLELSDFLTQGGVLVYFLCRPFVIQGPSLALDNYYWLESLAPDQPAERNVRHMSAVSHGRLIEPTEDGIISEFGPYLQQHGLEWSTLIRTEYLTEGYSVMAEAGARKCIAGQLFIVESSGKVVFLPSPYSPDFDKTLIDCLNVWYQQKESSPEELEAERMEAQFAASQASGGAPQTGPTLFDREQSEFEPAASVQLETAPAVPAAEPVPVAQTAPVEPFTINTDAIAESVSQEARRFEEEVASRAAQEGRKNTGSIDLSMFAQAARQLVEQSQEVAPVPEPEQEPAADNTDSLSEFLAQAGIDLSGTKPVIKPEELITPVEQAAPPAVSQRSMASLFSDDDNSFDTGAHAAPAAPQQAEPVTEPPRLEERATLDAQTQSGQSSILQPPSGFMSSFGSQPAAEQNAQTAPEPAAALPEPAAELELELAPAPAPEPEPQPAPAPAPAAQPTTQPAMAQQTAYEPAMAPTASDFSNNPPAAAPAVAQPEPVMEQPAMTPPAPEPAAQPIPTPVIPAGDSALTSNNDPSNHENKSTMDLLRELERAQNTRQDTPPAPPPQSVPVATADRGTDGAPSKPLLNSLFKRDTTESAVPEVAPQAVPPQPAPAPHAAAPPPPPAPVRNTLGSIMQPAAEQPRPVTQAALNVISREVNNVMANLNVPDWCRQYSFSYLDELKKEQSTLASQLQDVQAKLNTVESKIASVEQLKCALLAGDGDALKEAVGLVLSRLGWTVNYNSATPNEVLLLNVDQPEALVRIVRSDNHCDRSEVAHVSGSAIAFWEKHDVEPKGLLIACTWANVSPQSRNQRDFEDAVAEFARKKNLCLMTTLQLIGIYRDLELGTVTQDSVRKQMLDTNGCLTGYQVEAGMVAAVR